MKSTINRNYTINPPASTVRFIIKIVNDRSVDGQNIDLNYIAHQYLLFGITYNQKNYPDIWGFTSACALVHKLGILYFDEYGGVFLSPKKRKMYASSVAYLARKAINREVKNIERADMMDNLLFAS